MKKHILLNLSEDEIFYLKHIAAKKGLSVSTYVGILAKAAIVYHNLQERGTKNGETNVNEQS